MKTHLPAKPVFILAFLFCLISFDNQPGSSKLEVNGMVTYNNKSLGNTIIRIYSDSVAGEQLFSRRNGRFDLFLDYQKDYILEFSKEGFVTRKIIISAMIPEKVRMGGGTGFYDLNVEMVEMIKGLNTTLFDQPVAKYVFDEKTFFYVKDQDFESGISEELDKVNARIKALKKREYDQMIKTGDELLSEKKYENAWTAYNKAIDFDPDEPYPSIQIKKLKKLIRKEVSTEEGYNTAITKADKFLDEKNYELATDFYQKSLFYKPRETYPADKIAEIDSIASKIFFNRKQEYEKELTIASGYLASHDYQNARKSLNKALSIMPDNEYVEKKLEETDALEKAQADQVNQQNEEAAKDADFENRRPVSGEGHDSIRAVSSYIPAIKIQSPPNVIENAASINDNIHSPPVKTDTQSTGVTEVNPSGKIALILSDASEKLDRGEESEASVLFSRAGNLFHDNNQIAKALEFYQKSLELSKKTGAVEDIPLILNDMAVALYDTGKYDFAVDKYKEAYALTSETGNKRVAAIILNNIARIYENTYRYDNALNYYQQSLAITDELDNKNESAVLYEKIADLHFERNEFDKAIENLQQTLKIDEELKDESQIGATLNNMGIAYEGLGRKEEALDYYEKSLDITEKQGDKLQVSVALNNIGNVNFDWQKFNKAIEYYEKSIKIKEDIDYKTGLALSLHNIGNAYKALKNYPIALNFYKKSNDLAGSVQYMEVLARNYRALSEVYSATKNYKNAYENQKLFTEYKHSVRDEREQIPEGLKRQQVSADKLMIASLQRQIQRQKLLSELEANQRLKEIEIKSLELENQHAKMKRMHTLIFSSIAFIVIVAVCLFIVYLQYLQKKRANKQLTEKNTLITFQKKQITDSIRYASKIQKAVLPPKEIISKIVPTHFILNRPRDIVSGDYYWTMQRGKESIIAVADCTGHGVPGAFMSMLGIAFLNEIVNKNRKADSHEILDQLRSHVMNSLHQTGKEDESKDGMDIALCIIDMQKKVLQYSGAHNPLYLIRNSELTEIKADKMPIGISLRYNQPFKCHRLDLLKGDTLYIFSDGYYDQFGGPNKKKFSVRRFKELLLDIHTNTMDDQQKLLEHHFLEWKGKYDQLDDVLVMGIKIDHENKSAS